MEIANIKLAIDNLIQTDPFYIVKKYVVLMLNLNDFKMDEEEIEVKIIERLSLIAEELYARETGCNCVVQEFLGKGWVELCDEGIHLFEQLK